MATDIEEIKQRLDLVDVLREYVPVKAAGPANFKVLCPFHHEKTPSLYVSKDKQVWHCFGCGRGGDLFVFVQEMEGMDFAEALRHLAKRAGVELKGSDPRVSSQKTRLQEVLKAAAKLYARVLAESSVAKPARDYLAKRGLTPDVIEHFQIGYAPAEWDFLRSTLTKSKVSEEELFQAGLTIRRERGSGTYDRFRGRIMFPIADAYGTVVGFGGRLLEGVPQPGTAAGEQAKYINTPQSLLYDKSRVLYGLDRAKARMKEEKQVIVVEGYMDVIASHQAGITNVVAASGTALTPDHVRLLKRFASTLLFAFDMDTAGESAARRGIDTALGEDINARLISLPFGKDPDELVRRDPGAWKQAIQDARPVLAALFDRTLGRVDLATVEGKKQAAAELLPVLVRVANPIERAHYLQELARRLNVPEAVLWETLRKNAPAATTVRRKAESVAPEANRRTLQAERLLGLLLHAPDLFPRAVDRLHAEALPAPYDALYTQMVLWYNREHALNPESILDQVTDSALRRSIDIARLAVERDFAEADAPQLEHEFLTLLTGLQREFLNEELRRVTAGIAQAEQSQDAASRGRVDELVARVTELTSELHAL